MMEQKVKKAYRRIEKYLANTSWMMSEKILNLGLSFLVMIFMTRYLGPDQYGILAYAISLVSLFSVAGHVGLNGLVVRELVTFPDAQDEVMGTSFMLKGVGYLVGLILLLSFTFLTEEYQSMGFWILIILAISLLFLPLDIIDFWFQSQLEAKYTAISRAASLISSSMIRLAFVFFGTNLIYFAYANLIQAAFTALFLLFFYQNKSKLSITKWRASLTRAKELLSQGWMIFLGSIFAVIYLKIDQVMIKWLIGNDEVAFYAVSASLSEAWYFIPVAITASFFPKLIELKKTNSSLYDRRFQQIFDLLFITAFIVAVVVSIVAEPVINLMFGEAYKSSAAILVVHIWASLFIFMRAAFSKWILIEQALMFSLVTQGLGALVNIALNLFLIPEYGGLGAAYATLFSYMMASYVALAFHSKTRKVFWMMSLAVISPLRYSFPKKTH
jgi:O-antigen/teichoic acid export membrane protein